MRTHVRLPARGGFTLVELLFVLIIIVILVALSAAAVFKVLDLGPYSATVNNMKKIKAAVDTQWKAVYDKAYKDPMPTDPNEVNQLRQALPAWGWLALPGNTPVADPQM